MRTMAFIIGTLAVMFGGFAVGIGVLCIRHDPANYLLTWFGVVSAHVGMLVVAPGVRMVLKALAAIAMNKPYGG